MSWEERIKTARAAFVKTFPLPPGATGVLRAYYEEGNPRPVRLDVIHRAAAELQIDFKE